jgi:hypothetical protein
VGDGGGLHATGDAELGQDVRDVHAGGLRADEQGLGDFPVGVPGGDQQQDLALAAGEAEPGELVFPLWRGAGREADPRAPGESGGVGSDRRGASRSAIAWASRTVAAAFSRSPAARRASASRSSA